MAKPPKPGKCVHCLRSPVERNWDHVFPDSWYPTSTPENLAKWKVPSCYQCNRELGAIEDEFFARIALCLDPNVTAFKGLAEKALRSMNPKFANSPSEKRAREARAKRIMSELLQGNQIPKDGIFPGLGERWGRPRGTGMALIIPVDSFRRVTEKIVRGLTYWERKQFIEPPYRVGFYAVDDHGAEPVRDLLNNFGAVLAREPGVVVRRAVTKEGGVDAIYEVNFWQQFMTYAAVLPDESH